MTVEELFRQVLLETPAIAALVGERVHPGELPQASPLPAIVVLEVEAFGQDTTEGECSLERRRYSVDVHASTRKGAIQLQQLLKDRLRGATAGAAGVEIQGAFFVDEAVRRDDPTKSWIVEQDWDLLVDGPEAGS